MEGKEKEVEEIQDRIIEYLESLPDFKSEDFLDGIPEDDLIID